MTVSISQYVDLLVKKIEGVAKTDTAANKSPSNESIPSPLLNRGDTCWTQSYLIPPVAASTANIVRSYTGTSAVQCVPDTTTVQVGGVYPTWLTNLTDWIPQEFGSTYFVKAYVDNPGVSNPTITGTQIFDSGTGGVGEWYFDYQAGLLNFIGQTIPIPLTSGKVVYIVGYQYIGLIGVQNLGNITVGNIFTDGYYYANGQPFSGGGGGNTNYSNANVASYLPTYSGNLVSLGGDVSTTGNISGNFILGNGSLLTGINANYSNANVANYLPTYSGNLVSLGGDISTTGNISGNILTVDTIVANSVTTSYDLVSVQTTANTIILGNASTAVNQISWLTSSSNTTSDITLFSVNSGSLTSIDFNITATSGNNRQVSKILAVTVANTFSYTEYGSLNVGSLLGNFYIDIVGPNLILGVQPFTSSNVYYTVILDYNYDLHLGL